jgi:hypothetical protein
LDLFPELPVRHRPHKIKEPRLTERALARRFLCLGCGVDTGLIDEYYVVTKEVWLSANRYDHGMLCIGCLEKRLGRKLAPDDFIDCPVNMDHARCPKSARLLSRLLGRAAS